MPSPQEGRVGEQATVAGRPRGERRGVLRTRYAQGGQWSGVKDVYSPRLDEVMTAATTAATIHVGSGNHSISICQKIPVDPEDVSTTVRPPGSTRWPCRGRNSVRARRSFNGPVGWVVSFLRQRSAPRPFDSGILSGWLSAERCGSARVYRVASAVQRFATAAYRLMPSVTAPGTAGHGHPSPACVPASG